MKLNNPPLAQLVERSSYTRMVLGSNPRGWTKMENFLNEKKLDKLEKPPFLYHASRNKNIEVIEVRSESSRDKKEGDVVFATPDLALAGAFLTGFNDSWANLGKINGTPYLIIGDKDKFIENDNGGAIYKLKSDNFDCDSTKGMGKDEWTSKENVIPIEKTEVDSNLDFTIENGLQVYFFSKEKFQEFKEILKSGDVAKMIEVLEGQISENQKIGKNIIKFR